MTTAGDSTFGHIGTLSLKSAFSAKREGRIKTSMLSAEYVEFLG
jgi:hypothetical protein